MLLVRRTSSGWLALVKALRSSSSRSRSRSRSRFDAMAR
jgi:hypothetical protein